MAGEALDHRGFQRLFTHFDQRGTENPPVGNTSLGGVPSSYRWQFLFFNITAIATYSLDSITSEVALMKTKQNKPLKTKSCYS